MCGIAGFVDFKGQDIPRKMLERANESISHRGPDAEGFWQHHNVGICHRRLSIIDLSNEANQPMLDDSHNYVLSYNGEIYNFLELKLDLEKEGFKFKTNSDTEVVLYSLIHWGEKALLKFNGMFAFAFFDRRKQELKLARDRYGIKPLYYSFQNNFFSFGSEQKAIISNKAFKRSLNKKAMLEYFTFQNIFTDQTLLNDINLLQPATVLNLSTKSGKILSEKKYWDFQFSSSRDDINKNDYKDELKYLFRKAVKSQLVSDVEVGSYLSGGMDSGSITAIATEHFENLKTFTCGFDLSNATGIELGFDEREKANLMSSIFKTDHYEMELRSGDMEKCLNKLTWHLEEPRVGQSYPNYYISELASRHVKVVLSGTGGDEIFAGYPWRYYTNQNYNSFDEYIDKYYLYWQRLVSNSELKSIFEPIKNETSDVWTRDIFKNVFSNHSNDLSSPEDYINHSLYFEAKTFLNGLLLVEDKLSMAHSLETRVPFLDNDLVDFAMSCPVHLKLDNLKNTLRVNENDPGKKSEIFFQKTNDGKKILREVMKDFIPKEIVNAQKKGFSSPDASWFKGESINFVKKEILDKEAPIYNYLSFKSTSELVNEHLSGKKNRRLFIWSLLNINEWLKTF